MQIRMRKMKKNATVFSIFLIYFNFLRYLSVICTHIFEGDVKPKGGPLEIEIFFVEGG